MAAQSTTAPSAIARMQQPGPEAASLARRSGTWRVVMTMRSTPGGPPVVTSGLVAERTMVGPFLQEVMRPAPGSAEPHFRRLAYLT